MNHRERRRPTFGSLVCSLGLLLALGCASDPAFSNDVVNQRLDEFNSLIDEEVEDPVRAAAAKAKFEELRTKFDAQAKVIVAKETELKDAARQYTASEEELQRILSELEGETLALAHILRDGHFEVQRLVTEDEWNKIVNPRRKILGIF